MEASGRPLRADAERNRRLLLDAAAEVFAERGLEVGIAEIAQRAGVGHGTLFRRFPTKQHLIAAIVVDRMQEATARGRGLVDSADPVQALFDFLGDLVGRQQLDRALFAAVTDEFLANADIRAAHADLVGVLDALLRRAQETGAVRGDVGAVDVLMLFKGVCEASRSFAQIDPRIGDRQLDLVRSALVVSDSERPLRGRTPTLEDLERAFPSPEAPEQAVN
jgi:AcrR family transcriptional regulator